MSIASFLAPRAVAVVGASRQKGKVGHAILSNLVSGGFPGPIYPINPGGGEILGRKVCASIGDIPDPVDLAVIAIPAAAVFDVIDACGRMKIGAAIVISAGFKEVGPEGKEREAELLRRGRNAGVRILGPNCLGLISTHSRLNASFAPLMPRTGAIGLISQSGALIAGILDHAEAAGIGFSHVVSIGNKADLDEEEFIRAFDADPNTRVIAGYVENIVEGERFLRTAERVVPQTPIVLVKAGGTEAGGKAASSHTGSLAGAEAAYDCAFRRAGVIRARSIEDLFDLAHAFAEQPAPAGRRVAVITNAGGPGIMAADACERAGLKFRVLSDPSRDALRGVLPAAASSRRRRPSTIRSMSWAMPMRSGTRGPSRSSPATRGSTPC